MKKLIVLLLFIWLIAGVVISCKKKDNYKMHTQTTKQNVNKGEEYVKVLIEETEHCKVYNIVHVENDVIVMRYCECIPGYSCSVSNSN